MMSESTDPAFFARFLALQRRFGPAGLKPAQLNGTATIKAALIGRLAVALAQQRNGKGIGSVILYSALVQVLRIRERVGVTAVAVHGIDDAAATFSEHFGFTRFRDESRHLYYPLVTFETPLAMVIDKPADAHDE
jgi:hypothetical protein